MENLHIGNFAIATFIVGIFDLVIVMLVRTETILKAVERIKGIIKLDYKSRAKRSDDEIRISKKHELVARERIRNHFISMEIWGCKWTWNWSKELEPINIKGYCTDTGCYQPVEPYYMFPNLNNETAIEEDKKTSLRTLSVQCTSHGAVSFHKTRANFDVLKSVALEKNSEEAFKEIISKAILLIFE